ncbi:hypothetical protein AN958_06279 [Leucoagaricus sp. SymC.cos]|nr:hypothetical protein AN958_06279 [Leucoagaricus sp. SymC.cos]
MSSEDSDLPTPSTVNKGKRRADVPTEQTPLLQNGTYGSSSRDGLPYATPPSSRRRIRSLLTTVFLVSLFACLLLGGVLVILAWSYASRAARLVPDKVLNEDVALSGPFRADVLNTTKDGGLWLNVSGRMGFDAGDALGVNQPPPWESEGLLEHLWKVIGRWGIRVLDTVTVEFDSVHVAPDYDNSLMLLEARLPPIEVPLSVDPPRRSADWLSPVTTEVFVRPTKNATTLATFMAKSWKYGSIDINARVGEVKVRGGGKDVSWKTNFRGKMKNIQTIIHLKIPSLPGLPHPGRNAPFPAVSDFLTLESFRVSSQRNLTLYAQASIINPCPEDMYFTIPSLPFTVSLPNNTNPPLPVANVITHPFESTHPNITLHISGTVPALPKSSFPLLSTFLSRYLNAQANPILISSPLLSPTDPSDGPEVQIPAEFPAPSVRPNLLRNVTIKDMKIRASGTTFLASGTVFAQVVLPKGIDVGVDVFRVFPDVLVFDGEAPSIQAESWDGVVKKHAPPPMPDLPDPLPPRAFGHIRPDDWLPSVSVRIEGTGTGEGDQRDDGDKSGEETGAVYAVSAKVVDVPLQMLPGRSREFSNFVGKVIFGSSGAVAGLEGYAAVTLEVDGLPLDAGDTAQHARKGRDGRATLELTGLPVHGSVRVGKKLL